MQQQPGGIAIASLTCLGFSLLLGSAVVQLYNEYSTVSQLNPSTFEKLRSWIMCIQLFAYFVFYFNGLATIMVTQTLDWSSPFPMFGLVSLAVSFAMLAIFAYKVLSSKTSNHARSREKQIPLKVIQSISIQADANSDLDYLAL